MTLSWASGTNLTALWISAAFRSEHHSRSLREIADKSHLLKVSNLFTGVLTVVLLWLKLKLNTR
ncbi:hypothetical protein O9992_12285 [Vibrio lentus]|nr:hypothetical protein [Vibrio lentus]